MIIRVQSPRRDEETKAKWEPLRLAMECVVPEMQPPRAACILQVSRVPSGQCERHAHRRRQRPLAPYCSCDHGPRNWINKGLQIVVATKLTNVELLVESKPIAYNHVFCEAIRSLVLCDKPRNMIKMDQYPETLLLDVSRTGILQHNFMDLTTRCTLAVVSCHAVTAAPLGQEAFEQIGDLLANKTGLLIDSLDNVLTAIREILCKFFEVQRSSRGTLIKALKSSSKRDDNVHKLMYVFLFVLSGS